MSHEAAPAVDPWTIGPDVDPELLALSGDLPVKPAPVTLTGPEIVLRPLGLATDAEALHAVSDGRPMDLGSRHVAAYDPERSIWRYLSGGPFVDAAALAAWLGSQEAAGDGRPFAVVDRASGRPVGVANLMANAPDHLRVELGNIWYGPVAQGAGVNTEATWLLLRHAFGLGYRRVEWKCDARNLRSRAAALRMGFRFEGIFEQHYIIKGRERDTAWFRMLRHEWPSVEPVLLERVGAARA
ncbi:MAG: GNAT family protein [Candidatus Limnocylindrales bacterium]